MKLRNAPRTRKNKRSILLTFLLLLTLPVFVFSLLQSKSFDFRNKAFEDVQVSETNPCVITFPNVNPYSLEINNTIRVQVDALSETIGIKSISVIDNMGTILLTKEYDNAPLRITESFPFTPRVVRTYDLLGEVTDTSGATFGCVISSTYDVQGVKAITQNSKPVFLSSPRSSIPAQSLTTGVTYEYTIEAEDVDLDTINYAYSFTKDETWLVATVLEDGGNGKLSIKLKGATEKPGSYLANIFIHDGYSQHLSAQSWVISVSPKENTNPTVKILQPLAPVKINDEQSILIKWEGEDDTEITRYEVYISSNPVNKNTWVEVDTSVSPTVNSYNVNLVGISDGAYRIIVRAADNQIPEGIGMDVSEEILISRSTDDDDTPDDQVVLPQPQVINMSPTSSDTISNTTPTIKASLIASEDAQVDEESIVMELDGVDITADIKINKISDWEYTVIYLPEEPLSSGSHKVDISFSDTSEESIEKSWTFTIQGDEIEDSDYFNIFGLSIAKRTVYIIAGGLGLIALAIIVPMIIAALWKDETKEMNSNKFNLPSSIPPDNEIPRQEEKTEIKKMTSQSIPAPEPTVPASIPSKEEPANEIFEAPEPDFASSLPSVKDTPTTPQKPIEPDTTPTIQETTEPEVIANAPESIEPQPTPSTPKTSEPDLAPELPQTDVEQQPSIPEPEADLSALYEQIEQIKREDANNKTQDTTT